jgi:hypothetical protein
MAKTKFGAWYASDLDAYKKALRSGKQDAIERAWYKGSYKAAVRDGDQQGAAKFYRGLVKHSGGSRGFITVGLMLNGTFAVGAAVAGPAVDRKVAWRPLGDSITPSLMAVPVALGGGYVLRKYGYTMAGEAMIAGGVGLIAGNLVEAIERKTSGSA